MADVKRDLNPRTALETGPVLGQEIPTPEVTPGAEATEAVGQTAPVVGEGEQLTVEPESPGAAAPVSPEAILSTEDQTSIAGDLKEEGIEVILGENRTGNVDVAHELTETLNRLE